MLLFGTSTVQLYNIGRNRMKHSIRQWQKKKKKRICLLQLGFEKILRTSIFVFQICTTFESHHWKIFLQPRADSLMAWKWPNIREKMGLISTELICHSTGRYTYLHLYITNMCLIEHCKVIIMNSPVSLVAMEHAYECLICYAVTHPREISKSNPSR